MRQGLMFYLCSFVQFSSIITLCAAVSSIAHAEPNALFKDASDGVAFSYPSHWRQKDQRTDRFRIIVGDNKNLGGSCSLGTAKSPIYAQSNDQDVINTTTSKDIENGARQSGATLSIDVFKRTKIGNRPAIYYEASTTSQTLDYKFPLRIMSGMVKVGDRLYVINCSCLSTRTDEYHNIFYNVIASLTIR